MSGPTMVKQRWSLFAILIWLMSMVVTAVQSTPLQIRSERDVLALKDQYIVVYKIQPVLASLNKMSDQDEDRLRSLEIFLEGQRELLEQHGGKVLGQFQHALVGISVRIKKENLLKYSEVAKNLDYVHADLKVSLPPVKVGKVGTAPYRTGRSLMPAASWGQDRVDQTDRPLNGTYNPPGFGKTVHAYILDTGVRSTHREFAGRMGEGFNAAGDNGGTEDGNGHGTHVAGTIGGATFGLANESTIHSVRVFPWGSGSTSTTIIINGINWLISNRIMPAVANMSLGGMGTNAPMETAVANAVKAGVVMALAAGNSNADACGFTPAREPLGFTIGASDINDARASFSNWGQCNDIYAPGVNIVSASHADDTSSRSLSGTSMAAPHAAGASAVYLGLHPETGPELSVTQMVGMGAKGKLSGMQTGDPNILLNVQDFATGLCIRKPLEVSILPFSKRMLPAGEVTYQVSMKNVDSAECDPSDFQLSFMADPSLRGSLDQTQFNLAPKATANAILSLKAGDKVGIYELAVLGKDVNGTAHGEGKGLAQAIVANEGESPAPNGLNWRIFLGTWSNLPDFSQLYPSSVGRSVNVVLPTEPTTNFAMDFSGYLKIDTAGTYLLGVSSDDGTKLYINNTLLVNNDGSHGDQFREAAIKLDPGYYPYRVEFFQGGGPLALRVTWRTETTQAAPIPDTQFVAMPAKHPPFAGVGANQVFKLPKNSTTVVGTTRDIDGTVTSVKWTQVSGPNQATIANGDQATASVSDLVLGTYVFQFAVTDNDGLTATKTTSVEVRPTNVAPTLRMPANGKLNAPGLAIDLVAAATDSDGTIAAYKWEQVSGPTAPMSGQTTTKLTVSNMPSGTYQYRLTVTDSDGATVSGTVGVYVNFLPDITVEGSKEVILPKADNTLKATFKDVDGKVLKTLWTLKSAPAQFKQKNNNKGILDSSTLVLTNLVKGSYTVVFTAYDDLDASRAVEFTFNVSAGGDQAPPTVDAGADRTVKLPLASLELKATASSADGTSLTYLWQKVSGPDIVMEGGTTPSLLVKNLVVGTFVFKVTVTDIRNKTASDEVTVTVIPENVAPTCNAGPDLAVTFPADAKISGMVKDLDGNISFVYWQRVSVSPVESKEEKEEIKDNEEIGVQLTLIKPSVGVHVYRLYGIDAKNTSCMDEVVVTVK